MRIEEICIQDVAPVRLFSASGLADVVVLAGPNGVGKTRLIDGLVRFFRSPTSLRNIRLIIHETCEREVTAWGKAALDTNDPTDAGKLMELLQQKRRRSSWQSSVVQFESDRSIQQVQPYTFSWDYSDPFEEDTGWDLTFAGLRSRFADTLHSLFRKVRSHRERIASKAEELRSQGATSMPLNWQDPLEAFKTAFIQLLAPKRLLDPDPQRQQLEYEFDGQRFPISSLSAGEREVVNIVFDFLLRNPDDCVVLFDEPELHLHPELSYRLLQTLRIVGKRNQFIFCTHSPDIITASLDQSVLFIAPANEPPTNQAIPVRADDETNQALQLLGQSIGVIALGRRLILIEGTDASLDKQTYGMILRSRFPGLVLVPTGGKALVSSFDRLLANVLERSIWGVQFFMLCDGDGLPNSIDSAQLEQRSNGRIKVLPRYHLENYFLDENILSAIFSRMEPADSWLRDPNRVAERLQEIARTHASRATALMVAGEVRSRVGSVDIMPNAVHGCSQDELVDLFTQSATTERERIECSLAHENLEKLVRKKSAEVLSSLDSHDHRWKRIIPGRAVFNTFAAETKLGPARLKQMYIAEVEERGLSAFDEIVSIFADFNAVRAVGAS